MADAIAKIPLQVLANALRDVVGEEVDPDTEQGRQRSAELLQELLANRDSTRRLVDALQHHSAANLGDAPALPERYGRMVTTSERLAREPQFDAPPTGSAEFEAFVQAQGTTR